MTVVPVRQTGVARSAVIALVDQDPADHEDQGLDRTEVDPLAVLFLSGPHVHSHSVVVPVCHRTYRVVPVVVEDRSDPNFEDHQEASTLIEEGHSC